MQVPKDASTLSQLSAKVDQLQRHVQEHLQGSWYSHHVEHCSEGVRFSVEGREDRCVCVYERERRERGRVREGVGREGMGGRR